ncbi:MAG: hypothetical protein JRF56_16095 [Deltaproteobacteria bacterium]|nr:hypothetical protein [Deltaproteobacteria bacterium]
MGAFWNPHGGIIISDRKLVRNEVSLLKRKWSEQLQVSASPLGDCWKKIKGGCIEIGIYAFEQAQVK